MKWYMLVATLLYILDDSWSEGLQVENMLLGITFAYTVLKIGAIWMSIGLHWGGNVLYSFNGQGIWRLESITEEPLFGYISFAVTALMFPVMYMVLKSGYVRVDKLHAEVKEVPLSAKLN